jgi:hypothetical protein
MSKDLENLLTGHLAFIKHRIPYRYRYCEFRYLMIELNTRYGMGLTLHINDLINQGCESGLIQSGSGSGSSIFPQSGSTKCLNPDQMRIRIHKGKFIDNLFF